MYRTIVVGHDGTRASDDALALALQLRDFDAGRIVLVGVSRYHHGFADPLSGFVYSDWLREQVAQEIRAAATHVPSGVPIERQVIADTNPAAALNDVAETIGADLIVVGPTHHHLLGKAAGRTVAQRLLHGAPCAVAVAAPGQNQRFSESSRILVAYDGSAEAEVALDTAYRIAASTRSSVDVCTVYEPLVYAAAYVPVAVDLAEEEALRERAGERLAAAAARAPEGVHAEQLLLEGRPADRLSEAGAGADLVVTGSRHYGMLHRAIAGSVAGSLMTDGHVPVLVTPRPAAVASRPESVTTTAAG